MPISWNQTRVRVNRGGRVRCEEGWRLDAVFSEQLGDFDLWFVWAGRGTMRLRSGTLDLAPGVCVWMRPGGLYLAEQDPAHRLGVSYLHFDLLNPRGRTVNAPTAVPCEVHELWDLHYCDAVMQRIVESARRGGDFQAVAETLLRGLLIDLEARAEAQRTEPSGGILLHHRQTVMALAARIRESPGDVPGVAELARAAGYSPDHFTRLFREILGVPPETFVIQARLERAKQLLAESGLSIGEIAEALGYRDLYFFSRQFKRHTSRTPSQYRATPR
ncbi:MAG: AraC family transcriptional regulator [Chthoniobacteraceae bacterium]|nr:AraC family transcriptional regulator [Chthoniobacteraceae bacterium]